MGSGQATGRSRLVTALLVAPAAVFFALLLVLPLVVVLVFSFGERAPAGGYQPGFTFDQLPQPAGARHRLPEHADARAARHAALRC